MASLLGKAPKIPALKPPAPLPDEEAIRRAKARSVAEQMARSGRESTILTEREGL